MTEKFVVRLLSADDLLLAWTEVYATSQPEHGRASCPFWAPQNMSTFLIETSGTASKLSIHWCDLDVARVQAILEPLAVTAGDLCQFAWLEPVWLVSGMRDVPMPSTTVKTSVKIQPPLGGFGVRSPG